MWFRRLLILLGVGSSVFIFYCASVYAEDDAVSPVTSQEISFFHPSGMNGFIVYDVNPEDRSENLSYGKMSFDLSSPLGLPVTFNVEQLNMGNGSYDLQKLIQDNEKTYLEIFSIQRGLTLSNNGTLSSLHTGKPDITMVVLSANYLASDKFVAKLSTGLSQTVQEKNGSTSSNVGYDLDIAGHYSIAPGLTFSLGAGYSTNIDLLNDSRMNQDEKRSWSLISKLRLKF